MILSCPFARLSRPLAGFPSFQQQLVALWLPISLIRLGEFEEVVLQAVLRLGQKAYGAAIRRNIEGRAAQSRSALSTQPWSACRSRLGEPSPQRGGRRKKYFDLKPLGARALRDSYRSYRRMIQGLEKESEAL